MQNSIEGQKPISHQENAVPVPQSLEILREFSAPVEELFQAFTKPDVIKIWWWPQNLYADHVDLDFREGGKYFINMKGFDRGGGGMTGIFQEIIPNKRIVMSDQFADLNGKPISAREAKMAGNWPEEVRITLEFSSLGDNGSQLHLSQEGIPAELQADCIQGWEQSFDKLENYLYKNS
jgi:uncharacterized protein YndB with AHSA1/START domain